MLRFPDRRVDRRTGYLNVQNSVVNYPVQYLATGEIIPIAVCFAHWRMRKEGLRSFLVNTVHDSVVVEYHPEELEKIKEIMELSFTHDVYNYLYDNYEIEFNIPLGIGVKAGDHWSTGEEVKKDVEPPWIFQ